MIFLIVMNMSQANLETIQNYKGINHSKISIFIECKTNVWICFQRRKENNNTMLS